jgi:hypothetical protein
MFNLSDESDLVGAVGILNTLKSIIYAFFGAG